ncbi:hypothetical protein SPHINGOAX6_70371 [Sphingomonas sp. AX6]|nr:hypothetical protein SPHINGOAX6_70371 [Sphingomonas sp. AX6]
MVDGDRHMMLPKNVGCCVPGWHIRAARASGDGRGFEECVHAKGRTREEKERISRRGAGRKEFLLRSGLLKGGYPLATRNRTPAKAGVVATSSDTSQRSSFRRSTVPSLHAAPQEDKHLLKAHLGG